MPLDEFQKSILRILMPLRSPGSFFAGGSTLQRHGHRLSDDQGIFHDTASDVLEIARRDCAALEAHGMNVDYEVRYEGLAEAHVSRGEEGYTKVQWVSSGAWNYFEPVTDPVFGYRLHMADLAVNKVLAAGGRREVRDYVDLALIHEHVMPLWHAIWAGPGKDASWTPLKLLERIAATNQFRQSELDEKVQSTLDLSMGEIGSTIREALDEAREIFLRLPGRSAGRLFVDASGQLVNDVASIVAGGDAARPLETFAGGAWPSGPDIDALLIDNLVRQYGWEGQGADTKYGR